MLSHVPPETGHGSLVLADQGRGRSAVPFVLAANRKAHRTRVRGPRLLYEAAVSRFAISGIETTMRAGSFRRASCCLLGAGTSSCLARRHVVSTVTAFRHAVHRASCFETLVFAAPLQRAKLFRSACFRRHTQAHLLPVLLLPRGLLRLRLRGSAIASCAVRRLLRIVQRGRLAGE
jgi:hypothetical protein